MPTPELMTWVPSQRRWTRQHNGKRFYISARKLGCPEETKEGSILQANAWWRQMQATLDASLPVPRAPRPMEDIGTAALGSSAGDWPTALADLLRKLAIALPSFGNAPAEPPQAVDEDSAAVVLQRALLPLLGKLVFDGEPLPDDLIKHLPPARAAQIDRAARELRGEQNAEPARTIRANVDAWYERQQRLELAGSLKVRTVARNKHFIEHFAGFTGETADVDTINADTLEGFYRFCLDKVAERRKDPRAGWSVATATKTFSAVRGWIRWLSESNVIPLPGNINSRSFRFGSSLKRIETWTIPEVQRVIDAATGRLKLALLLFCNCGFVQVDASELRDDEVDWSGGRIIRRRSKTADKESAPVVNYLLWPITFKLLRHYRSGQDDRVLLTKTGRPFISHEMKEGKMSNSDSFEGNYRFLKKKLGFKKPLKLLRKTSASLIESHPVYGRFTSLFLGHSPSSMADRHYAAPPQKLFDEAILWLGKQYGFADGPQAG